MHCVIIRIICHQVIISCLSVYFLNIGANTSKDNQKLPKRMQTMSIPRQDVTLLAFSVASLDAPLSHQRISSEPANIIVLLRAHTTEEKKGVPV